MNEALAPHSTHTLTNGLTSNEDINGANLNLIISNSNLKLGDSEQNKDAPRPNN